MPTEKRRNGTYKLQVARQTSRRASGEKVVQIKTSSLFLELIRISLHLPIATLNPLNASLWVGWWGGGGAKRNQIISLAIQMEKVACRTGFAPGCRADCKAVSN